MNKQIPLKKNEYFSYTAIAFLLFFSAGLILVLWWRNLMLEQTTSEIQLLKITSEYFKKTNSLPASATHPAQQKLLLLIFRCQLHPCNFSPNSFELTSDYLLKIQQRETSKIRMIHAESIFMLVVILSGYMFIYYAYARERRIRKQTQNTIFFAMHEMRQPIQSISLLLESISRSEKNRKNRKYLKQGEENLGRLNDRIVWMANVLSQTSQIASSRTATLLNINDFIYQLMNREFQNEKKRIHFIPTSESIFIETHSETLHHIARNLLENALKYSTENVSIRILFEKHLKIQIENIISINATHKIHHWGELFFRNATHSIQNESGYGLGLYISRELARAIHASIDFSTRELGTSALLTTTLTITKLGQ